MRRIGVYGGTFDPPHVAHLVVAERAFTALRLDELIIVPCGTPPLKAGTSAPAEARLELTRLAFGDRLQRASAPRSGGQPLRRSA